jgi:hypothetical protein
MLKHKMVAALAAASMASVAIPAAAQITGQGGLVNVSVGNVILQDILTDVEVTALNDVLNNNVLQVQVPVGVAANVCNVSAAVLGRAGSAGTCEARSGSQALAQAIRKQYLRRQ